ncbi:hypothetical protein EG329_003955 [Mollisiaceae sp. DMI_Dod_QoI]|nr:hypothetical protein EG329_003955 [Helotiales sp. DMI_Dod_QoI]
MGEELDPVAEEDEDKNEFDIILDIGAEENSAEDSNELNATIEDDDEGTEGDEDSKDVLDSVEHDTIEAEEPVTAGVNASETVMSPLDGMVAPLLWKPVAVMHYQPQQGF